MTDRDFDQVASILFDGLTSLEKIGSPGTLIPLTKDTRAVLAGEDSNNIIIVATRFGYGRCLVFAHNGYPYIFLDKKDQYQPFVSNCQRWLTRGHQADFLSINDAASMNDISAHGKILVWDGHCTKSDAFMNDLVNPWSDWNRYLTLSFCVVQLSSTRWRTDLWHDCLGMVTIERRQTLGRFSLCSFLRFSRCQSDG